MVLKEKKQTKKKKKDDSPQKEVPEAKDPIESDKGKKKKDEIQELKDQAAAEKDRALRLSAEFENYKKRTQREINDFKKFANESIFRQLLSVVDNLERAISAARENSEESALFEGVKLTHKDIIKLFETFNVKQVTAENEPFDPNFHQAVTQEETDEFPDNTVTRVLQKGYLLQDRLIRPAMVVVSKKAKKETEKHTEEHTEN
ncbi:MAG: nucleotide exchange factor GrpE [Deltaproteobacteria bacterium]|nr:MAG: nucleotide exchange factor GrpE [Deltaproteobacteria bacterium]